MTSQSNSLPFTQKNMLIVAKPNSLDFNLKDDSPSYTIVLQNISKTRIAWRLQTNCPTRYFISPNCGFLTVNECFPVTITLVNAKKFHDRHRFMLTAAVAGEMSKNRKEFWAHPIDFSHLHCIRIKPICGEGFKSSSPSRSTETAVSPSASLTSLIMGTSTENTCQPSESLNTSTETNVGLPVDNSNLIAEIRSLVAAKDEGTRKMLEAVNNVKKLEMELDKVASVTREQKIMHTKVMETINEKRKRLLQLQQNLSSAKARAINPQ